MAVRMGTNFHTQGFFGQTTGFGILLDKMDDALGVELPTELMNMSANAVRRFWVEWLTKGRGPKTLGIVTGNLRNSIQILQRERRAIMVGTTVNYGAIHEFGWGDMPIRKHREPGVREAQSWIEANSARIANRYIKGIVADGEHDIDLEMG